MTDQILSINDFISILRNKDNILVIPNTSSPYDEKLIECLLILCDYNKLNNKQMFPIDRFFHLSKHNFNNLDESDFVLTLSGLTFKNTHFYHYSIDELEGYIRKLKISELW